MSSPTVTAAKSGKRPSRRRAKVAVALALAAAAVAAFAVPEAAVRYHLSVGRDAIERDDPKAALAAFQAAEAWDEDRAETHFWAARAYRRAGLYDQAYQRLDRAQAAGFDADRVRRERVLTLARSGRVAEAAPFLPELIRESSEDAAELCEAFVTGYCLSMNLPAAAQLVDVWQKDYPDSASPLVFRGKIAWAQEDWPAAAAAFRAALELDPSRADARLGLAQALHKDGKLEAAEENFRLAAQARPTADAWIGLGDVLLERKKPGEAADAYRQAARVDPLNDEAPSKLGRLALESGNAAEAVEALRPVVERWPDDVRANYLLAKALQALGRADEAQAHFAAAAAGQTELDQLHRLGDEVNRRPEDAGLRYEIGRILLRYQSREEGYSWLKTVLQYDPTHAGAHEALADYHARRGETDLARMHGRLALK